MFSEKLEDISGIYRDPPSSQGFASAVTKQEDLLDVILLVPLWRVSPPPRIYIATVLTRRPQQLTNHRLSPIF